MAKGRMTEIFLLHKVQTDSGTHSASYAMGKLAAKWRWAYLQCRSWEIMGL